jgi:hypothetical protein
MPNGTQGSTSSGWLVGAVIIIIVAAILGWASYNGGSGYYRNSNRADTKPPSHTAAGPQTNTGAAGTNNGTKAANPGTNAASNKAASNNGPPGTNSAESNQAGQARTATASSREGGSAAPGTAGTSGTVGANTGTSRSRSEANVGSSAINANQPGALSSIPPAAAGSGSARGR